MKNTGENHSQPAGYKVTAQSKINEYADPEIHFFLIRDYPNARLAARTFQKEMAKNKNLKISCVRYY